MKSNNHFESKMKKEKDIKKGFGIHSDLWHLKILIDV